MEGEKKEGRKQLEHLEGGKSVNDLVDKVNAMEKDFEDKFKKPLDKERTAALKITGLDKTKGANIKHAYLGAILAMASALNLTKEQLMTQFEFKGEAPFLEVKVVDEWQPTFDCLKEWVQVYVDCVNNTPELLSEMQEVPKKASDIAGNASSDFADLDLMAKAKMGKAVFSKCNQIKDRVKILIAEAKAIGEELETFKDALKSLQEELTSGKVLEDAKKCKAAEKDKVKSCYEFIYGEIKVEEKPKGNQGGDDEGGFCKGGKCAIF